MKKLGVHVGGPLDDIKRRVVDAVERAKRDEAVREDHVAFAPWEALASVKTAKRFEMLRHLRRQPEASAVALAGPSNLCKFVPVVHK